MRLQASMIALFMMVSIQGLASENLPLCQMQSNREIVAHTEKNVFDKNVNLVTFIQGSEAMYRFDDMQEPLEHDPQRPGENAVLKRSKAQVCGQYELMDLGCQVNWCNILEAKK